MNIKIGDVFKSTVCDECGEQESYYVLVKFDGIDEPENIRLIKSNKDGSYLLSAKDEAEVLGRYMKNDNMSLVKLVARLGLEPLN